MNTIHLFVTDVPCVSEDENSCSYGNCCASYGGVELNSITVISYITPASIYSRISFIVYHDLR